MILRGAWDLVPSYPPRLALPSFFIGGIICARAASLLIDSIQTGDHGLAIFAGTAILSVIAITAKTADRHWFSRN